MPTVVVMDVSLSMTRPVSVEGSEEYQRKHLAAHGLTMLFEHMATNYKLEFTALVVFSSLWELMVPFTRDYNTLQVQKEKSYCMYWAQIYKKKKSVIRWHWIFRAWNYLMLSLWVQYPSITIKQGFTTSRPYLLAKQWVRAMSCCHGLLSWFFGVLCGRGNISGCGAPFSEVQDL